MLSRCRDAIGLLSLARPVTMVIVGEPAMCFNEGNVGYPFLNSLVMSSPQRPRVSRGQPFPTAPA